MSADHADLTPAMLTGTPVGGPGGSAACDSCNKGLSDGERWFDGGDAEADTVYAYATRIQGTNRWTLRWVSCEDCGPPGDGDTDEDGEAVAKAALDYDPRIDAFALADPEMVAPDEQADIEGGDER